MKRISNNRKTKERQIKKATSKNTKNKPGGGTEPFVLNLNDKVRMDYIYNLSNLSTTR